MIRQEHDLYKKAMTEALPGFEQMREHIVTEARGEVRAHKKTAWVLPAIACACAAVVVCTAVPPVRAAISQWLGLGADLPQWEEIEAAREENDMPEFVRDDFEWLNDIHTEVTAAGGDGFGVHVEGILHTDRPLDFYKGYLGDAGSAAQNISLNSATLTYEENGETKTLGGTCNTPLDEPAFTLAEDGTLIADEQAILDGKQVPIVIDFYPREDLGETLPTGTIDATIEIEFNDSSVDDMAGIGVIGKTRFQATLDVGSGQPQVIEANTGKSAALAGSSIVTLLEGDLTFINKELSLDGMQLSVESTSPSEYGMEAAITVALPESWSDEECKGYADNMSAGLEFIATVDGQVVDNVRPWPDSTGGHTIVDGVESNKSIVELDDAGRRILRYKADVYVPDGQAEAIELTPVMVYMIAIEGEGQTGTKVERTELPLNEAVTLDFGSDSYSYSAEWGETKFEDAKFTLVG